MKLLTDYQGVQIRLTDERLTHILNHPELANMEFAISETLQNPEQVRVSQTDKSVILYYRYYTQTVMKDKWLCVVVKNLKNDAFILTAYLTDSLKKRRNIMAGTVKVWFDKEGDYLEVLFSDKPGYMRETDNDAVMERVDEEGNLLGFSVLGVSSLESDKPLFAELVANFKD